MSRLQYDKFWEDWRPSPGPIHWRGPHHAVPEPAFVGLCQEAERHGLRIGLTVSTQQFGEKGREYRVLDLLTAKRSGMALVADIRERGLSGAVAALRRKLPGAK